jgi:predicted amino acid-binding ACT domain protein
MEPSPSEKESKASPGEEGIRRYYPRIVGLAPHGGNGHSGTWAELLVTGHDEIGGAAKLATLLAKHNVNLAPSGGYYLVSPDRFVWTTFADFRLSTLSLDDVVKDVRRLDFVSKAEAIEIVGVPLDRFLFPVIMHGDRRGIIMGLSPLLKMEERLAAIIGTAGSVVMFEEGKAYATEGLQSVLKNGAGAEPRQLLDTASAWGRVMGWGIFTVGIETLDDDGTITVMVDEPPNGLSGNHESHFFDGVVVGAIEFVLRKKVYVALSKYDEPTRTLQLVLRIHD